MTGFIRLCFIVGALLIALGLVAYLVDFGPAPSAAEDETAEAVESEESAAGEEKAEKGPSPTAFIPSFFGVLMIIGAVIGLKPGMHKHGAHVAAGVALLGVLGGLGMGLPKLLGGTVTEAVISQLILGVLSLIVLVAAIQSFIAARKAKASDVPSTAA